MSHDGGELINICNLLTYFFVIISNVRYKSFTVKMFIDFLIIMISDIEALLKSKFDIITIKSL